MGHQNYIDVGIPFLTILLVWLGTSLSNKRSTEATRASIEALGVSIRSEMKTGFDAMRAEMKLGYDAIDKRLGRFEAIVDRVEGEIRIDHERRITVLEERVFPKAS